MYIKLKKKYSKNPIFFTRCPRPAVKKGDLVGLNNLSSLQASFSKAH